MACFGGEMGFLDYYQLFITENFGNTQKWTEQHNEPSGTLTQTQQLSARGQIPNTVSCPLQILHCVCQKVMIFSIFNTATVLLRNTIIL